MFANFEQFSLFFSHVKFEVLSPSLQLCMLMLRRSVPLPTLSFPGKLGRVVNQYFVHIHLHVLSFVIENDPS